MNKTQILIVEDEPIIAADLEATLRQHGFSLVGVAYSDTQALDMLATRAPDMVLLDISIKGQMDGIDIAGLIRDRYHIPFIFITSFSDPETLSRAKRTLPYGYIVKPFKDRDILSSIEMALFRSEMDKSQTQLSREKAEQVCAQHLTDTEYKILLLLWEGKPNKLIASELFVSVNTIKTHVKNLFTKFEVQSRTALLSLLR